MTPEKVTETSIRRAFMDIANVEAVPARILLLAILRNCADRREEIIPPAIDLIVRFFIRRHLTGQPKTRDLDAIFIQLTDKLTELGWTAATASLLQTIESHLSAHKAPLLEVLGPLRADMGQKSAFARVILTRIEVKSRTPENAPDLWAIEADGWPAFQLEHVLPQGDLPPENWWRQHLFPLDPSQADAIQDAYCQKFGNLTLTGFNQELSNKPFVDKRDYTKNGHFAGYKNDLVLNLNLRDKDGWQPTDIDERTGELIKILVPLLRFEGEAEPDYSYVAPEPQSPPLPELGPDELDDSTPDA